MSIDTTFKPIGPTVSIGQTPSQAVPTPSNFSAGITTFRIFNTSTTFYQYLAFGNTSALAAAAFTTAPNGYVITIPLNTVCYLELPYNTWFVTGSGSVLIITPGQGGVGG
jgi:hypothetical protein